MTRVRTFVVHPPVAVALALVVGGLALGMLADGVSELVGYGLTGAGVGFLLKRALFPTHELADATRPGDTETR